MKMSSLQVSRKWGIKLSSRPREPLSTNRMAVGSGMRRLRKYRTILIVAQAFRPVCFACGPRGPRRALRILTTDPRYTLRCTLMIGSFKHRGLKRLYERGDRSGIRSDLLDMIEDILVRLDEADTPQALNLPSYRLHQLKGDLKGFWSVTVRANWRIVFRFQGSDAFDVELIDYH